MDAASPVALDGNYFPSGSNIALNTANIVAAGSPSAASFTGSAPSPASDPSTPSSTTSSTVPKIALRPNTAPRPAAVRTTGIADPVAMASTSTPSPMSTTQPLSMTSKTWVIPPRPKPGRKPATDTPPTKRKAQNRAAQRAFRERRAARVGELEEQLEEQKEEHDKTTRELQERIHHLENEAQSLRSRCQWLEKSLEEERQRVDGLSRSWEDSQTSMMATRPNPTLPTDILSPPSIPAISQPQQSTQPTPRQGAVDQGLRVESRPTAQSISISQIISPPEEETGGLDLTCGNCPSNGSCTCAEELLQDALQTTNFGCGGCTADTRCACLEESFRATMAADLKRPLPPSSPLQEPEGKRQRSDTVVTTMETDFTSLFASTSKEGAAPAMLSQAPPPQPLASVEPRDACGFCEDGTYCFCADASVQAAAPPPPAIPQPQALAHQIQTPPPSEDDVIPAPMPMEVTATGAIKLPGVRSMRQGRPAIPAPAPVSQAPVRNNTGGCGPNGPGTCAQCLADPKSGLFCRSLAANINRKQEADGSSSAVGCCGNGGPGGCCKGGPSSSGVSGRDNVPAAEASSAANTPGGLGLSISCAEAYQTLASHRNFSEAADDIGSWLPKLRAAPIPDYIKNGRGNHGHLPGRWAPIEVEAASIMAVLKDFDVRFGRGE